MSEQFIIGKIVNTHGVKGEVKIIPLTDNPMRFEKLKSIYVEINNSTIEYKVNGVKFLNNFIILKLENVDDIQLAEKLKECYIKIDRKDALRLPKNTYYIADLIGIKVIEENGEELGIIKDIHQPGGNDLYIVEHEGRELMIPAVKEFIKKVDLENKLMTVNLPEGLKEL